MKEKNVPSKNQQQLQLWYTIPSKNEKQEQKKSGITLRVDGKCLPMQW